MSTRSKNISKQVKRKNPAAVALGKLGGRKGGKARALRLAPEERSAISSRAGKARAAKLSASERSASARRASLARWNSRKRSVSAVYEYGPFGELLRATGPMAKANPFRFSTKYEDDETDLLYYGHRYYTPSTGRWLSRDPINERGGPNLYGFVAGNPISLIDLFGLKCCGIFMVMEVRGLVVPEGQQKGSGGNEKLDGFKVLYLACPTCDCPKGVKLVQAMEWSGGINSYPPAFDTDQPPTNLIVRTANLMECPC